MLIKNVFKNCTLISLILTVKIHQFFLDFNGRTRDLNDTFREPVNMENVTPTPNYFAQKEKL